MQPLADLLRRRLAMMREDAAAVAKVVESAFKGRDELDDEALDAELRSVFYDLEGEDILAIRRQEADVDGRRRRFYYWHLKEQPLGELVPPRAGGRDPDAAFYDGLGDAAWERRPPRPT